MNQNDTPFSQCLSPGHQDEQIWPIAKKLGIDKDLEKKIGYDSASNLEFKTNDEYADEQTDVIPFKKEAEDKKAEA